MLNFSKLSKEPGPFNPPKRWVAGGRSWKAEASSGSKESGRRVKAAGASPGW